MHLSLIPSLSFHYSLFSLSLSLSLSLFSLSLSLFSLSLSALSYSNISHLFLFLRLFFFLFNFLQGKEEDVHEGEGGEGEAHTAPMHVDGEENVEQAATAAGTVFSLGDYVFVKNRADPETKPLIVYVTRLWKTKEGSLWCRYGEGVGRGVGTERIMK